MNTVHVTYDGALDPLGASQVVPYLLGLARRGVRPTLVSFEKPERWADRAARERLARQLEDAGVAWRPLPYHRRPRLAATAWDLAAGARAIRRAVRDTQAVLVHCRGDVAMAMARLASPGPRVRLVCEARGLFRDERVEVGSWRAGGLTDRLVLAFERGNLRAAHGLLCVMASPGLAALQARRDPLPPFRHLPNSVDTSAFRPRAAGTEPEFGLAYHGSLGGWYPTAEIVSLGRLAARHVPGRVLFLTPQPELARAAGADPSWAEVTSAVPRDVPAWLARARAAFFVIQPSPAKRASSPTKFAEALACGLPVLANGASGDLESILEAEGVGALVRELGLPAYAAAARRLAGLLSDPQAAARCRSLAERRYSLDAAVAAYHDLYLELAADGLRS